MSDTKRPIEDFFAAAATAAAALDLRPTEARLIRNCLWARSQTPNGWFLSPPRTIPSALRLIERGYLTKAAEQPVSFGGRLKDGIDLDFGIVVVLETDNWNKFITDAIAAQKVEPDQGIEP